MRSDEELIADNNIRIVAQALIDVIEVFTNIVDDFIKRTNESLSDNFLNLIFGFENYLKNAYEDDVVHCAVNSALYDVCNEKDRVYWWELYNCAAI